MYRVIASALAYAVSFDHTRGSLIPPLADVMQSEVRLHNYCFELQSSNTQQSSSVQTNTQAPAAQDFTAKTLRVPFIILSIRS